MDQFGGTRAIGDVQKQQCHFTIGQWEKVLYSKVRFQMILGKQEYSTGLVNQCLMELVFWSLAADFKATKMREVFRTSSKFSSYVAQGMLTAGVSYNSIRSWWESILGGKTRRCRYVSEWTRST